MAKKKSIALKTKLLVIERAKHCCEYCKSPDNFSTELFSCEHILPRSKNGSDLIDNLAFACIGCNIFKSNKIQGIDPISRAIFPLFNPRTMEWETHFMWNNNFQQIIGKTVIGRVTIEILKLNRQPLQNLRKALVAVGVHPPS
jgi:hypothetical protein